MWKKPRKTQGVWKNLEKTQGPQEKIPRTQDSIEKHKILGENPWSGNADLYTVAVDSTV